MTRTETTGTTPRKGHYLGTEIDGKWWRRFHKLRLFARGNGMYWWNERALYFRRYLTRRPIEIPFAMVHQIETGHWHAGRWCAGQTVVKLIWEYEGQRLSSGFVLAKDRAANAQLITALRARIGHRV
jgi:hypothetical protein